MSDNREQHYETTLRQIGHGNVLAISGGRARTGPDHTLILPVAHGYTVEIVLDCTDTYTVRRVFTRAGKRFVKAEVTNVYCGELGDTAYRASCYLDPMPA